ncbi:5'-hydroxyaverantin dehydrogenase [Hypsizygus marmoreus]|uniref:5'-hydroxyaverantin dehydrogenase n=1 Tax=Hypsizygus marmoreus TaxID=39966 RepID=A0A369JUQ5_HYPMA|nr:5'-hydroxyaverantin dehydrogenase [Hypsizygus marmoreus]
MSTIPDDKLFEHATRLEGKVVVITGAANGIGKEAAARFASFGAKVVVGDLDVAGAENIVQEIKSAGGQAVFSKCDVTVWEDQVTLFELAIKTFGSVDVVVPNAGVAEIGSFETVQFVDGKPVKPNTKTIEVNLLGTLYTTHLALHYLELNRVPGTLKSVVLLGSMASWAGIPQGSLYAASKHAVLGLMRSLYPGFAARDIRIATVHPFFADTAIVPVVAKLFLAGIPLTTVPRIAGAIVYAATNPDPETSGCAWLLTDNGPVFMVPKEEFKMGVYKMIDERANALLKGASGIAYYARLTRDLFRILGKPVLVAGIGAGVAKLVWDHWDVVLGYFPDAS